MERVALEEKEKEKGLSVEIRVERSSRARTFFFLSSLFLTFSSFPNSKPKPPARTPPLRLQRRSHNRHGPGPPLLLRGGAAPLNSPRSWRRGRVEDLEEGRRPGDAHRAAAVGRRRGGRSGLGQHAGEDGEREEFFFGGGGVERGREEVFDLQTLTPTKRKEKLTPRFPSSSSLFLIQKTPPSPPHPPGPL